MSCWVDREDWNLQIFVIRHFARFYEHKLCNNNSEYHIPFYVSFESTKQNCHASHSKMIMPTGVKE